MGIIETLLGYKLSDVLPCPKCNGDNIHYIYNFMNLYHVWCCSCQYGISRRDFPDALKFWNGLKRKPANKLLDAEGGEAEIDAGVGFIMDTDFGGE